MKRLYYLLIFFGVGLCLSTAVAFVSLRKFILKQDLLIKGKTVSARSKDIRKKIFEKYDVEEVSFQSDVKLTGLLIKRDNPKGTVIACHGFQRSKEFMYPFIDFFDDHNVLLFDFRGQGQSEDSLITFGITEAKDVIAAVNFVKSRYKLPLVLLGVSMGGAAILKAADMKADLCDAMIIDSTFSCLTTVIALSFNFYSKLPNFPFVPLILFLAKRIYSYDAYSFKPIEFVDKIRIPIFFIHSAIDKIIPTQNTLDLYSKSLRSGNNTHLWITPPVFHATSARHYPEEYKLRVSKFLDTI